MKNILQNCKKNKEKGFTLIEMMIVLVIISILLLIAVPNLTKNQELANNKGCEATKELIKAQKIAYEIDNGELIDGETGSGLDVLLTDGYVDTLNCPNGDLITLDNLDVGPDDEAENGD